MKAAIAISPLLAASLLLTGLAFADERRAERVSYLKLDQVGGAVAASGNATGSQSGEDAQMEKRKSDFFRFAQTKLQEMNRNHHLSRARMKIDKTPDGSYRAVFHQIDDSSMACEVSRSQSKSIPYVAVLSYKEQVFSASCPTPQACRNGDFTPAGVIPNRHIFSYRNGSWQ